MIKKQKIQLERNRNIFKKRSGLAALPCCAYIHRLGGQTVLYNKSQLGSMFLDPNLVLCSTEESKSYRSGITLANDYKMFIFE